MRSTLRWNSATIRQYVAKPCNGQALDARKRQWQRVITGEVHCRVGAKTMKSGAVERMRTVQMGGPEMDLVWAILAGGLVIIGAAAGYSVYSVLQNKKFALRLVDLASHLFGVISIVGAVAALASFQSSLQF
jgi:hypothetical protein